MSEPKIYNASTPQEADALRKLVPAAKVIVGSEEMEKVAVEKLSQNDGRDKTTTQTINEAAETFNYALEVGNYELAEEAADLLSRYIAACQRVMSTEKAVVEATEEATGDVADYYAQGVTFERAKQLYTQSVVKLGNFKSEVDDRLDGVKALAFAQKMNAKVDGAPSVKPLSEFLPATIQKN